MLKKALLVLAAVVAALVVVIATRPDSFQVERSAQIKAPPQVIFAAVNDLHQWDKWSPWEKLDPAMKKTHTGPAAGQGAIYAWSGNDKVGEGRMTILDSRPGERVEIKLEFIKPFESMSITTFTFAPAGAETKVTWSMTGKNNFMAKAFGLFMNMDEMIGKDFEQGLASLREISEAEAKKQAEAARTVAATPAPAAPAEAGAAAPAAPPAAAN